ncbi:neutral zinc metallopeptidase [Kribbella sp. CA-293567]|uniref:neutral zinc metallopeptidase n=1 Tax=Kribbella sp. CA-293567 TaxID=3002436 RepID=UPI0022DE6A81|nr:neutral zinc metallopeptidase [Kribbella sp. CA-293567]WBQ04300.1 neutral zinc metallopeptidase [Kribbella sp. CA-293567]
MADDERGPDQVSEPGPQAGHFLPGGAGDRPETPTADTPRTALTPADAVNRRQLGLGKARPLDAQGDPSLKKAAPLPTDPGQQGFGAPPAAPLAGAPVTPLRGGRQFGGPRPVGWHTTSTRTGVPQFASEPPELKSPRRFSRPLVGLISALALILVSGGAVASYKLIDSFDSTVANPLTQPTVKPSTDSPQPILPDPTVTKTVEGIPDAVRLQKNELYKLGKMASMNCALPKVKPDSQANVLRFYQAMLPCLAETWEPLVLKAGYPFRQPKLVLYSKGLKGGCGAGLPDYSYYCPADETITMQWALKAKYYKQSPVTAVNLLVTMAHEYSHHVQQLTNILISSDSQAGWAKNKPLELEWSRRLELQADCLGAVFLSANRKTLQLTGQRLEFWRYGSKNGGDELDPKKDRDHGSRKNSEYWQTRGFSTADPASCNTYAASSARVS